MAKRKTRKQKIIADLRHKLSLAHTPSFSSQQPYKQTSSQPEVLPYNTQLVLSTRPLAKTIPQQYIQKDLVKTVILSTSIIALQIILFFLVKNNLIALPFLNSF